MSRASGTTTSAPRPPSTHAATAWAIASGHRSPAAPGARSRRPRGARARSGAAGTPGHPGRAPRPSPRPSGRPAARRLRAPPPRRGRAAQGRRGAGRRRGCPPSGRRPRGRAAPPSADSTGSADTTLRNGASVAVVLCLLDPLEHVPVDVLAAEPDLDARPGQRPCRRATAGNEVLEGAVEVRGRQVDADPRDRQLRRRSRRPRSRPRVAVEAGAARRARAARRPPSRPRAHPITRDPRGAGACTGSVSRPRPAGPRRGRCAPR